MWGNAAFNCLKLSNDGLLIVLSKLILYNKGNTIFNSDIVSIKLLGNVCGSILNSSRLSEGRNDVLKASIKLSATKDVKINYSKYNKCKSWIWTLTNVFWQLNIYK